MAEIDYFRRVCDQYRWMATAMVFGVGAILVLGLLLLPPGYKLQTFISNLPAIGYLFGVWSIGRTLGEIAKGRPVQAALHAVLCKVGVSLGASSLISVFAIGSLLRLAGIDKGGYVRFDIAGMALGMIGAALFLLGHILDQALAAQAELDEMI